MLNDDTIRFLIAGSINKKAFLSFKNYLTRVKEYYYDSDAG